MNFMFIVQSLVLLLVLNNEGASASPSASALVAGFTNGTSIVNYLKNQSKLAQEMFSSLSSGQIRVGNRTIKIMKQGPSSSRMSESDTLLNPNQINDLALFYYQNGTISYNADGEEKPLLTVRAGEFHIDEEIFSLVFPGFSMDLKGMPGNTTTMTTKGMEELNELTTLRTTTTSTGKPTTKKNPLPQKSPKNAANFLGFSLYLTISIMTIQYMIALIDGA